jgi:FlaG/FlaF family flagellin (archaellin)
VEKFRENKDAVSPVVGVILLVGLTVIMISTIAVSVFAFSIPESAPQARIVVVEVRGNISVLNGNELLLKHKGGDALSANDTKIIINGYGIAYPKSMNQSAAEAQGLLSERNIVVTYFNLAGNNYGGEHGNNLGEIVDDCIWQAAKSVELYGSDGRHINNKNNVDQKYRLKPGTAVVIYIVDTTTNQVIAVSQARVKQA